MHQIYDDTNSQDSCEQVRARTMQRLETLQPLKALSVAPASHRTMQGDHLGATHILEEREAVHSILRRRARRLVGVHRLAASRKVLLLPHRESCGRTCIQYMLGKAVSTLTCTHCRVHACTM